MNAYQRKPVCTGRLFVSVSRSISFQQSMSVDGQVTSNTIRNISKVVKIVERAGVTKIHTI